MKLNEASRRRLSVAPMLAWTTPVCRILHRLLAPGALLYTEMVTPQAILRGTTDWLRRNMVGSPVALQLGGRDPELLAAAAEQAASLGYSEINLNVGCPSKRAQAGGFGACLLYEPRHVMQCVLRMCQRSHLPITVKTRTRVDEQVGDAPLDDLIEACLEGGCKKVIVHARKAWLKGVSPAQNRNRPPLEYERVYRIKSKFPELFLVINGGITTLECIENHLQAVDGVMLGRIAYLHPRRLLEFDQHYSGSDGVDWGILLEQFLDQLFVQQELGRISINSLSVRPLLGIVQGCHQARLLRAQIVKIGSQLVHNPQKAKVEYRGWTEAVISRLNNLSKS